MGPQLGFDHAILRVRLLECLGGRPHRKREIKGRGGGLPGIAEGATPFSPSRPARGRSARARERAKKRAALTAALRRDGGAQGRQTRLPIRQLTHQLRNLPMLDMNPMRTVARRALLPSDLTQSVPAAFAETPDVTRTSRHYQFISTARVI